MSNFLTYREEGDVVVVDVGKLTTGSDSALLRLLLDELAAAGYQNILLNMARVTDIDRASIGELLASHTSLAPIGGALKLFNLQESVKRVFHERELESVLELYEDESEAISSLYSANRQEHEDASRVLPGEAYLG